MKGHIGLQIHPGGEMLIRFKDTIKSNTFTMEWPPKSGHPHEFPEIDRAEWFDLATARKKIKEGQEALIDELEMLKGPSHG